MNALHDTIKAAEIFFGSVAGLVIVALIISTIRTIISGKAKPWVIGDVESAMKRAANEGWPHRILVAFDIAFNVIFIRGQQDETLSTHAWRASLEGKKWGIAMNWWLDLFQSNHGPLAASGDLERATVRVMMLSKLLEGK